MTNLDLSGKIAIVSGASRGVGRTYALALAGAGAQVMALGRTAGALAEVAATARAEGMIVETFACDVCDEGAIIAAVGRTVALFGGIDILVNNAVSTIRKFDVLKVPASEWEDCFATNLQAPYAFMRESVSHMATRGGGAIINITSAAAQPTVLGSGAHGFPAYAVTKAALERLTTYFAAEFAPQGIAVNALSPGHVAYYTREGRIPDAAFWGLPLLHLAVQRSKHGLTGEVLHTYGYGRSWGPVHAKPPEWDADIRFILSEAGISGVMDK